MVSKRKGIVSRITVVTTEHGHRTVTLTHNSEEVVPVVKTDLDNHGLLEGIMSYDHTTLQPIPDKPSKASTAPDGLWGNTPDNTRKIYDPYG